MPKLTDSDRRVISYVKILADQYKRELAERDPSAIASEWVAVTKLIPLGVRTSSISKLVKAGRMESSPSDGFGEQVRAV